MFLLLEIILTVTAWRKGWRSKALIPMATGLGAAIVMGLIIGLSVGATNGSLAQAKGVVAILGLAIDLLVIVALAIMVTKAPKPVIVATPAQVVKVEERPLLEAPQV